MEPIIIFSATLIMSWSFFIWDYYLALRQIVLWFGILPYLWQTSGDLIGHWGYEHETIHSIAFTIIAMVLEAIFGLPWGLYDTFVIEERHGFNKQTLAFYLKDKLKGLALGIVISAPIIAVIIYIVRLGGQYFFIYMWLFISVVIFFLMTIYPQFIAPLFDKYTPLPDGELKTKIEELASRLNFPLKKLYVVEGSKRSAHSNAYMYGFGKNKRIVLFDTLLEEYTPVERTPKNDTEGDDANKEDDTSNEDDEKLIDTKEETKKKKLGMNNDEVVAVLGHELGHWALWHTVINLFITEANMLLMLACFSYFYQQENLYTAFGFNTQPTLIGLMIVFTYIMSPYNELLSFMMTLMSRRMEFSADRFSTDLGYGSLLSSGLIKLGKDNLSLPIDDWLYSMWNHSHPPIPERIAAIRDRKRE